MRDCKRCGCETSWTNDTVTLFGGYSVHLCNDCRSAFHQAITATDIWVTQLGLLARNEYLDSLASAGTPVTEDVWLKLQLDSRANEREGWLFAEAFCQPLESYRNSRQRSRDEVRNEYQNVNTEETSAQ